jgi:hypothetical protein
VDRDHDPRRSDVGDHPLEVAREELVGVVGGFLRRLHQADAAAGTHEQQPDRAIRQLASRRAPDGGE